MSDLVADCPRCGSEDITFDIKESNPLYQEHDWRWTYEAFAVCRRCSRSTIFILRQQDYDSRNEIYTEGIQNYPVAVNRVMDNRGYVNITDLNAVESPEHLPEVVKNAFNEGAKCKAIGCYNAAGTMFRLCVDLATRPLLPEGEVDGLNSKTRRDLGLRLPWLFDNGVLPEALRDLSACVKDDGNDAAHQGTLTKDDADDLLDFTNALLERIFTEPERLRLAKERRDKRRKPKDQDNNEN